MGCSNGTDLREGATVALELHVIQVLFIVSCQDAHTPAHWVDRTTPGVE